MSMSPSQSWSVSDANSVKPRRAGAGAIKNPLNALSKPAYSKPGIARRTVSHEDIIHVLAGEKPRRNERYFSCPLLNGLNEGIAIITPDRRIMGANDAFLANTGLKRNDAIGRYCFDALYGYRKPCRGEGEPCKLPELLKSGKPFRRTYFQGNKEKSGRIFDALHSPLKDDTGRVIGAIVTLHDVTELVEAKQTLESSEAKYRLVVDNANDAVFIAQDGVIKFPNRKTLEVTGLSTQELAKTPFITLVHPADADMVMERHKRRLAGEDVPTNYPFRVTVRITWEGRPATLNFLRDMTEQRRLEEQVREAQKMETMGMLASGVAHDFNNLLMGITGYVSLILLDMDPKDQKFKRLKEIEQYADSGTQLVKQLMRLVAGEKYHVEAANLNEIIKKVSWLFGRIRKNMTIETRYEEALWIVDVEGSEMEQVFLNLFVNASQAMDGTGRLYVNTENVVLWEPEASAKDLSPGRYVKCVVADTGKGMDEETLKRIFDPFFTTKEKGIGTGLGLTVVHTILKNHGGVIEAYSKKGEGSIFTIHLPASEKILPSQVERPERGRAIPAPKPGQNRGVSREKTAPHKGRKLCRDLEHALFVHRPMREGVKFMTPPDPRRNRKTPTRGSS